MSAQISAAMLQILANSIQKAQPPTLSIAATATAASPNLTGLGSAVGLQVGAVVVTPSASVGLTIVAVDDVAHTATLSGNAGITGAETYVFSPAVSAGLGMTVGLFTGAPTLTVGTVYSDLAQPTYTGYALQAVTMGSVRGDAQGDIIIPLSKTTWQPTATVSPEQTATGFFVVETGSNTLLFAQFLPVPKTFQGPLDALDVLDEIYVPASTVWGGICATCGA